MKEPLQSDHWYKRDICAVVACPHTTRSAPSHHKSSVYPSIVLSTDTPGALSEGG